jgi:hypothetical protein
LTAQRQRWTLVDAYLIGILFNLILGFLLAPILYDTSLIASSLKLATLGLLLYTIYVYRKHLTSITFKQLTQLIANAIQPIPIILGTAVSLLFLMFAVTHSIGFDDVSNLKYIYEVGAFNRPFPRFLHLIGHWDVARYPLWGITMGVFSHGITGGVLLVYYVFSATLLAALVIKVYQLLQTSNTNKTNVVLGIILTLFVLSVGGLDDYLNHGMYPLKQAKLLYIIGLLYLSIGWWVQRNTLYLFIGISLTSAATFYHLNLALLHAIFIVFAIAYILYKKQTMKNKLFYASWIIAPLMIGMLLAIIPERGFLQFIPPKETTTIATESSATESSATESSATESSATESSATESSATESSAPPQSLRRHSVYERFLGQNGNYDYLHIKRAFSLEVILIPLILLIIIQLNPAIYLGYFIIFIASISLVLQITKTLPKQLITSSLRSGTGWILYDILRYKNAQEDPQGKIFTDTYTAFYLKLLGKQNVVPLEKKEELLAFSPLFNTQGRPYVTPFIHATHDDVFLLNGRYWGMFAVNQWKSENTKTLQAPLTEIFNNFYNEGKNQALQNIVKRGVVYTKEQVSIPLLAQPVIINTDKQATYQKLYKAMPNTSISIYKDSAIITLSNLQPDELIEMKIEGKGDIARYLGQFTEHGEEQILEYLPLKNKRRRAMFKVLHQASEVKLLFKLDLGQFGGLGTFEKAIINRHY